MHANMEGGAPGGNFDSTDALHGERECNPYNHHNNRRPVATKYVAQRQSVIVARDIWCVATRSRGTNVHVAAAAGVCAGVRADFFFLYPLTL